MTSVLEPDETCTVASEIHHVVHMVLTLLLHLHCELLQVLLQADWLWSIHLVSKLVA